MKRKIEEEAAKEAKEALNINGCITLRSGKILTYKPYELPKKLEEEIESILKQYKEASSGYPQHAQELLTVISDSINSGYRNILMDKIEEVYNVYNYGDLPLIAGGLASLLIGRDPFYEDNNIETVYHDIIRKKLKTFDLEASLLGSEDLVGNVDLLGGFEEITDS